MRLFTPSNVPYSGILHFIYFQSFYQKNSELLSNNGVLDGDKNPLIELVSKAGSAKVWSSSESESNDLIIDLLGYKAIPSHYQLGTSIGGSPPTIFKFFGSNDKSQWFEIDSIKDNLTLCPYDGNEPKCQEETVSNWPPKEQIGPFRYFKLSIFKTRYKIHHPDHNTRDIRLSGFDLYGTIYKLKENIFKMNTCQYNKLFCSHGLVILYIIYLSSE